QRERRRLAQHLHDHLQQLLVAARINLNILHKRLTDTDQQAAVRSVDELLNQSIHESRSLTGELAPPVLYEADFGVAMDWLARHVRDKHGLQVHVEVALQNQPIS